MNKKVPIVEVFASMQGEGKSLGRPSVFVRFWGCNLRCRFKGEHCDTPYATIKDKELSFEQTPFQTYKQIMAICGNVTNIVFTGGEPFLYQEFIKAVMYKLNQQRRRFTCEVETNGTIEPVENFTKYITQFNISPKLESSNQLNEEFDKKRSNFKALNKLYLPQKAYFKFVVSSEKDIVEIGLLEDRYPDMEIYLMPEGVTRQAILRNSKKVVDLCLKYDYNFSPREHIIIWDSKRGV